MGVKVKWKYLHVHLVLQAYTDYCFLEYDAAQFATVSVIGIFHWHNSSGRTIALGSAQSLKEMSIVSISWALQAAGAWG